MLPCDRRNSPALCRLLMMIRSAKRRAQIVHRLRYA